MSALYTVDTLYSSELRVARYTNGQRLTADDLHADQQAALQRARQVGRATGWGIVDGLIVTPAEKNAGKTTQAITITKGLALNRAGDPVALNLSTHTINLSSVRQAGSAGTSPTLAHTTVEHCDQIASTHLTQMQAESARFDDCRPITGPTGPTTPPAPTTTLADGVYLLAIRPIARDIATPTEYAEGGLGQCAVRWQESGVEFRVIPLDKLTLPNPAQKKNETHDRFRSRVAAWCFRDAQHAATLSDPFTSRPFADLAHLDAAGLEQADVPLAVLLWVNQALVWVDNWPVRRRVVHPNPAPEWRLMTSDATAAQSEARFYQFQEHLLTIDFDTNPTVLDLFHWLPPVCYLPVRLPDPVEVRRPKIENAIYTHTVNLLKTHATTRWKLTSNEADEIIDLAVNVQKLIHKRTTRTTMHLVNLEMFFKSYIDTFDNAVLTWTYIDQHQAVRLLNGAWHDSAINLDAGERIQVCLVFDIMLLGQRLRQFLDRLKADRPDAVLAGALTNDEYWELQERWQRTGLHRKLIRQTVAVAPSEQIAVEPVRLEPLYAVVTRQDLTLSDQTKKPRD